MSETGPDPVTAYLVEVGERGYRHGATGRECNRLSDAAAADIPRLLSAIWKAFALHEPTTGRRRPACRTCLEKWPCSYYQAISTALLGKDGT